MATSIGTITAAAPSVQAPVLPNAKSASGEAFSTSLSNASSSAPTNITTVNGKAVTSSPQTVIDPTSGTIITEFLNSNGTLQSQAPSTVAVAYLRAGLTEEGFSRDSPYESLNTLTSAPSTSKTA